MISLQPSFTHAPPVKVMYNVGAGFDIVTGTYVKGRYGESILNGGVGYITGICGAGNTFKSTLEHFLMLSAMSKFPESTAATYDTEINIHEWHLKTFVKRIPEFNGQDILEDKRWVITDRTIYTGDEYFDVLKGWVQNKIKGIKGIERNSPFLNRDRNGHMQIPIPTFGEIDSFSEFVTQDVIKMQDENSLGESGANMVSMRQGMQKNRLLQELPTLTGQGNHPMFLVTHIGSEFSMDPRNPPPKKLQFLKGGQKIKGAPEKFTFITSQCWHCYNAAPLVNQSTKAPEFPRNSQDDLTGDTDLTEVSLRLIRNKSGPTGMTIQLVVSQQDGVLPSLTEFYYIKENGRFGLDGNDRNYNLFLLPEVKLSRTTVRGKIDADPQLQRALNITSELCQMHDLWHNMDEAILCTPKELYEDIKALGYDWGVLLATRGWWTLENDKHPVPFLSTMDLLNMRAKKYVPYWFKDDQIPVACKDIPRKTVF